MDIDSDFGESPEAPAPAQTSTTSLSGLQRNGLVSSGRAGSPPLPPDITRYNFDTYRAGESSAASSSRLTGAGPGQSFLGAGIYESSSVSVQGEHGGEEDEDDEIAATLPIYLSHSLNPRVHLFQYPVHHRPPAVTSYAAQRGQKISARIKEQVGRVEIEIPVDTRPSVWNEDKAEELGFVKEDPQQQKSGRKGKANGDAAGGADGTANGKWGEKTRLRSEEVPPITSYWAGLVHEGALHIHPISKILQFRPSLSYLDAMESAARSEKERDDADDEDETDAETGPAKAKAAKDQEIKTVQMQLASRPDRTGEIRRGSKMGTAGTVGTTQVIRQNLLRQMQKEAEDQWQSYRWEGEESPEIVDVLSRMLVQPDHRAVLDCKTKPLDMISRKEIGEGARLRN